jgi:hypothetical protein
MKEYKILGFQYNDRDQDSISSIETEINEFAADNWVVINFIHTDNLSGKKYPFIVMLEREIEK